MNRHGYRESPICGAYTEPGRRIGGGNCKNRHVLIHEGYEPAHIATGSTQRIVRRVMLIPSSKYDANGVKVR